MRRIKKRDHENLSHENLSRVQALLNPEEGKPITKKEACEMLNISYNTTRLNKILEDFEDRKAYVEKRKQMNRGKPASKAEIAEAVMSHLRGESVAEISKALYRSPGFVKALLERVGVPQRPTSAESKSQTDYIPEACVAETFSEGEIVWSARYHRTAVVGRELSPEYQKSQKGLGFTDYEDKYGAKCFQIYVLEAVDSSDSFFPGVETGGFNAYELAYDLGKLTHLEEYGVDLTRI